MKRMLAAVIVVCLFASSAILAAEKKADKKAGKKSEKKVEQKAEKKAEKKPEPKAAKVQKSEASKSSKWSLSAGVRSREVDVDFTAAAPAEYTGWRSLVRRPQNTGATSFYNYEGRLEYEDGAVIYDRVYANPSRPSYDGTTYFSVESDSQIGSRDVFNTVSFHSTRTKQWSELSQSDLDGNDDAEEAGAYVAARRSFGGKGLGCVIQYGINKFETGSGRQETARQTIMERQARYETTYDVYGWGAPLPSAPFDGSQPGTIAWLIFDAAEHNADYGFMGLGDAMEPRQTKSSSQRTLAVLTASSQSDLDVDVHDVLLGLEWTLPLGDWFGASLSAGPTLNVIAWDMEHTTEWVNETTGMALQTMRDSADDEEIEVGAAAQLTASVNLNKKGSLFCEGSVGYNWVDEVEVKTDSAAAEIDLTSVSGALGVGVRF